MQTTNNIGSKLVVERINSAQLSKFLGENELYTYRNKSIEEKLVYLFENCESDSELIQNVMTFLNQQIKYNKNRVIVTVPIEITTISPLTTDQAFSAFFPNYNTYNNIMTINDRELDTMYDNDEYQYKQVFEQKLSKNGQIECISKAFVKKNIRVVQPNEDEPDLIYTPVLDTVWIDVFPQKNYYRIHLAETLPATRGQVSLEENINNFSDLIENKYKLTPINHSARHVFYKIYKELTEVAESPYVEKVAEFEEKINHFVTEISRDLDYHDGGIDSINLNIRMKKLLERAIIQQDFKQYIETTTNREGFVDKFQYQDPSGGRVLASSHDDTYDMSKHDIYFDTKETIDINKMLNTLWVRWFKTNEVDGKREISQIKVRYESHHKYYITHFLYSHVSKEECEYVLPKFDEYETRPLG